MIKIINLVEDTAGKDGCLYEHGLSFYMETGNHKLLMDCGATGIFARNAETLGVDLKEADTCILSHGHYDHAGGIPEFAKINQKAKIYIKDSADGDYYHITERGEKYIGIRKEIMELPQCVAVSGDLRIDQELFLFSGITGTRNLPKGNRELKKKENGEYVQDAFDHEQCLVITQGKYHILMSGCAHNGILNILDRYFSIFHSSPDVVISGFHMMQKNAYTQEDTDNIRDTARLLLDTGAVFYTGHCTGQEAFALMKEIMGEKLQPIHSGKEIKLAQR